MAFIQVETWSADAFQRIGAPAKPAKLWPWGRVVANGREVPARRAAAVALSLAIHLGAIWLILDTFTTGIGKGEGKGRGDGIVMIDLSGLQSADSVPSPSGAAAPQPIPIPLLNPLEASAPSDSFKPEWTISKLQVATTQPVVAVATATPVAKTGPVNAQAGSAGTGAGGGGQGYDPYAGASPQRRDPNAVATTGAASETPGLGARVMSLLGLGASPEPPVLNKRAFEEATQAIRRALPGVQGRLEISVRISRTGAILDARIKIAALGAQDIKRVRSVLIGRKLFDLRGPVNEVQWLMLPTTVLT